MDANPITLGFPPNGFNDACNRRLTEVDEIHRDLGAPLYKQTQCLDVTQPARRMSDGSGDFLGDIHVFRGEIDVERDQGITRSNDCRSRRTDFSRTVVWMAIGIGCNLGFQSLVLTLADVLEIDAFRAGG